MTAMCKAIIKKTAPSVALICTRNKIKNKEKNVFLKPMLKVKIKSCSVSLKIVSKANRGSYPEA